MAGRLCRGGGQDPSEGLEPFVDVPPYEYMAAVRDRRAVSVPPWVLGCVTHHRILGYETMARALHPEAFK